MARRRRQRLALLSLLLLLLPLLAFAARNLPPTSPESQGGYVVVIDAGSTGSRAHIYKYGPLPSPSPSLGLSPPRPLLPEVSPAAPSLKREPGLSATRPEDIAAALKPLLEYAASKVPREHHASTDVLVLATAGLRALPSAEDREARLRAASDAVAALSPFPRPRRGAVATLRGVDEGALAWVAANAAAGTLVEKRGGGTGGGGGGKGAGVSAPDSLSSSSSLSGSGTIGIAEIGGTSMQVTFEVPTDSAESGSRGVRSGSGSGSEEGGDGPPPPSSPSAADIFHLELPSSAAASSSSASSSGNVALFRLFSRSWEGLGLEAARATTAAAVSLSSESSSSASASSHPSSSSSSSSSSSRELDPCVPPGAVVPLPPGVVVAADDADASSGASSASSSGVGTGDFDACRSAASQALRLSCAARPDHCPLPSDASAEVRPPPNLSGMELLGIENLRHTANALGLLERKGGGGGGGGGGRPTLREIVAAGRELCGGGGSGGDNGEEKGKPSTSFGPVEAARHCFGAAYTVALLTEAFGIRLDERNVEFSGSVAAKTAADAAAADAKAAASASTAAASSTAAAQAEKEPERVTPEWTAAAAALAAADVAAARAAGAGKKNMRKGSSSALASPLPFEALLRAPGELALARFAFHRRRHRTLARLFLACGAFAAAAVAVRSLSERAEARQQRQQRKRSSSAAGGGGDGEGSSLPPFPSSVDAASDALGAGDGVSPLRGAGSKSMLSKRGGGGAVDLSAEAAPSSVSPKESSL